MIGRCALCLETKVLKDSHLIPRAAYPLLRDRDPAEGNLPDPVTVAGGVSMQLSRQLSSYLLCEECEDRFNRLGERIVLADCERPGSGFCLREQLLANTPAGQLLEERWYPSSRVHGIDAEAHAYFALSVFWRASVGRWDAPGSRGWRNALGPKYEEQFRSYLVGEAELPTNVRLLIFAAIESKLGITVPMRARRDGYHEHSFDMPGIEYRMFLGSQIDRDFIQVFKEAESQVIFVLHNATSTPRFRALAKVTASTQAKGRLALRRRP